MLGTHLVESTGYGFILGEVGVQDFPAVGIEGMPRWTRGGVVKAVREGFVVHEFRRDVVRRCCKRQLDSSTELHGY